ncbi:MAG: DNA-binding protein [Marinobacter sp.]|nr:DNA-binding protein [Marinobacter sp.]
MARGGITQPLVEDARNRLLARSIHPSIDAIRAELGNTGSKTTISGHLKAIEARESTRLDDEALLSGHVTELVGQLAQQLRQDAQETIEQAQQRHQAEASSLREALAAQTTESEQQRKRNDALAQERNDLQAEVTALREALSNLQGHGRAQAQRIEDLTEQVQDKQRQVDSLEEKHGHAREALEHYRGSVKEQREQDQRRHEQQVQQVQAEQRQLQQALSVKRDEQTQATRETTRIFTELTESRKLLDHLKQQFREETLAHRRTANQRARLKQDVTALRDGQVASEEQKRVINESKAQIERLATELKIKNEMLTRLLPVAPEK